ncbi:uncharacterized protein [Amphiura filiformis]|uniref:uncharacterized protein n=1 Tax=Amphiura filiformis TaxID=82378 RepID=UPI003B227A68
MLTFTMKRIPLPSCYMIVVFILYHELPHLTTAAPCKVCTSEIKDPSFLCWECDTKLPSISSEQTTCYNGTFPAVGVIKMVCSTGKCISYETESTFSRACFDADMEKDGYCDGSNKDIQRATCCTDSLCNEPTNSGSRHTIYLGTFFSCMSLY